MVGWIIAVAVIAGLFFVLPPLFALFPKPKGGGGGLGNALSQFNAFFNPGERYVIEAQRELPDEDENDEPKDPATTPPPWPVERP